jgi:hypothetical protein
MSEPRAGKVRFEKPGDAIRQVEVWSPRGAAIDEGNMAAVVADLECDAVREHVRLRYDVGCHERIVHRVYDQGRAFDGSQEADGACPVVVVAHALEPVQRRRDDVIELRESSGRHRFVPVERRRVAIELPTQCILHAL